MKRVRIPAGTSSSVRLAKPVLAALTLLLALGLVATAAPAFAEGSPAESADRLAAELDRAVGAARADSTKGGVRALATDETPEAISLTWGQTMKVGVEPGETTTFRFTVDTDALVGVRASASGTTSDPDGFVGTYTLKRGDDYLDSVNLRRDEADEGLFPLPAGTYTIEYWNVGASSTRELSLLWTTEQVDLGEGQLPLPNNRSLDAAVTVEPDRPIHGVFYWGYNASSEDSRLDGHYYRFQLDRPSAVTIVLGCSGTAQVTLQDEEGNIPTDAAGNPIATTGSGSISVDCGELSPGTYTFLVISNDGASWKRHYVCEVLTHPLDDLLGATRDVHRLYNRWSGEHVFTADEDEYASLVKSGWNDEQIAWLAPRSSDAPVWRLANPYTGEHLYTAGSGERDSLIAAGWSDEGVCWYSDGAAGRPVYRLFNPHAAPVAAHHYTTDVDEYESLGSQGWQQEGEVWYGAW